MGGKKGQQQLKKKYPNLIDDQEDYFVEKAENALKEIFSRYDLDKDGCLNRSELDKFAIGCNGKPFDQESVNELTEAFDCNEKGYLTQRGFMEMYFMQSISDPEETWKDIEKHGYNTDFTLTKKDTNNTTPSDKETTTTTTATTTTDNTTTTTTEEQK
eukprot:gene543-685_t